MSLLHCTLWFGASALGAGQQQAAPGGVPPLTGEWLLEGAPAPVSDADGCPSMLGRRRAPRQRPRATLGARLLLGAAGAGRVGQLCRSSRQLKGLRAEQSPAGRMGSQQRSMCCAPSKRAATPCRASPISHRSHPNQSTWRSDSWRSSCSRWQVEGLRRGPSRPAGRALDRSAPCHVASTPQLRAAAPRRVALTRSKRRSSPSPLQAASASARVGEGGSLSGGSRRRLLALQGRHGGTGLGDTGGAGAPAGAPECL